MFKMVKRNKLKTPEWILEGYDSPEEYEKAKGKKTEKKKEKSLELENVQNAEVMM